MDICLLWVLCVVRWRSLRRAGPSSRGVLPSVVCLKSVWLWSLEKWGGLRPQGAVEPLKEKAKDTEGNLLSSHAFITFEETFRLA
jgi:hypothetical protein